MDSVHSEIERQVLRQNQIYSPLTLMRKMVEWANGKNNYHVLQFSNQIPSGFEKKKKIR